MTKKTETGPQFAGMAADSASQMGSSGRLRMISIDRITILSTQPPKYPAAPPRKRPMTKLTVTPIRPTVSESCAPCMMRECTVAAQAVRTQQV